MSIWNNGNANVNKFKSTLFNGDIDISGNVIIETNNKLICDSIISLNSNISITPTQNLTLGNQNGTVKITASTFQSDSTNNNFTNTTNCNGKVNINNNIQSTNYVTGGLLLGGNTGLGMVSGNINMFNGSINTGGQINCGPLYCTSLNPQAKLTITDQTDAQNWATGSIVTSGGIGVLKNIYKSPFGASSYLNNVYCASLNTSGDVTTGTLSCSSLNFQGKLTVNDGTDATSWANGSIVTSGGIGVLKNIYQSPYGTSAYLNNVYCASLTSNSITCPSSIVTSSTITDEGVNNNITVGNNILVANDLTVNGEIHNNNTIYCKNLTARNSVNYPFKNIGYIYINSVPYPIVKSCYDTKNFYSSLNLQNLLNNNVCYMLIYPYYSITFYNTSNVIILTIDNTTGNDLLYNQINLNSSLCSKFIIKYINTII